MKTPILVPALALGFAALVARVPASAQERPATPPDAADPVAAPAPKPSADPGLRFNFRNAPLETVLNYMSDAAGYVIVLDSPVRGTVDMWSAQPVSREEAVQLLNIALNKNGYSASVQGRNLVVSAKEDAKKRNIPIRTGNDPQEIPLTAEMVMQIIPLRRIDATTAARDLGTLFPPSATVTANQDSNSLVVTDTEINVHHIVEIVSALDSSADSVTTMRVFRLRNADPVEMAQLITNLFQAPTGNTNNNNNNNGGGFNRFGGFGQGPAAAFMQAAAGGNFGGGGRRGGNGTQTTPGRQSIVTALPDPRTYSVIVTASKETMPQIVDLVAQLDSSSGRKQKVFVYTMENADVKQVETILKNLFQTTNTRSSTNSQADPLASRASSNSQTSQSSTSTSLNNNGLTGGAGGLR